MHVRGSELRDESIVRDGSELQLVECMDQNYFGMVTVITNAQHIN